MFNSTYQPSKIDTASVAGNIITSPWCNHLGQTDVATINGATPSTQSDFQASMQTVLGNNNLDDFVGALKASTGWTDGGSLTFVQLQKLHAAWAAGTWQLKTGEADVYQLLDAENGTTVLMELTVGGNKTATLTLE